MKLAILYSDLVAVTFYSTYWGIKFCLNLNLQNISRHWCLKRPGTVINRNLFYREIKSKLFWAKSRAHFTRYWWRLKGLGTVASLVFTQQNRTINVFSRTLTCSASVGRAMKHLLSSLWTKPLNELAELHFLGLI